MICDQCGSVQAELQTWTMPPGPDKDRLDRTGFKTTKKLCAACCTCIVCEKLVTPGTGAPKSGPLPPVHGGACLLEAASRGVIAMQMGPNDVRWRLR